MLAHPLTARVVRAVVRSLFVFSWFALAWVAGVALQRYGVPALLVICAIILVGGTALGVALDSDDVDALDTTGARRDH